MRLQLAAIAASAFLGLSVAAHADTFTTYTFSGSLSSGGSVSGSLTLDLGAGGYSATSEDITVVAPGNTIEFNATPTSSVANGLLTVSDTVNGSLLQLIFADGAGGLSLTACDNSVPCRVARQSPFISILTLAGGTSYHLSSGALSSPVNGQPLTPAPVGVTPEPSSMILLGTGLMGMLGVARRRIFNA